MSLLKNFLLIACGTSLTLTRSQKWAVNERKYQPKQQSPLSFAQNTTSILTINIYLKQVQ